MSNGRSRWRSWRSSPATERPSTKQVISATDMQAFGTKKLSIPFDATGKKWVRFAMWDVAGNGAFTQPQWLAEAKVTK